MLMPMVTLLMVYAVFSFLLSALYVRYTADKLAKFLRRHFYIFPFFPVTVPLLLVACTTSKISCLLFRFLRRSFERISGKKTYRRRSRYDRY